RWKYKWKMALNTHLVERRSKVIDWTKLNKAKDVSDAEYQMKREAVLSQRLAAYRAESDHMKIEADYDAAINGEVPDYSGWVAKVKDIKERYPLP
ncbi:hypothetical protein, partial [Cronobacter sakazakii]